MEKAPGLSLPFVDAEDVSISAQHQKPTKQCSSGEWDSSVPEEGRALLDEKGLIPVPFATRVVSSLIAMLQGVEVLCNLAILYLFKDDFRIDPALLAVVLGALRLPWTVKPLWALAADNFPLFGYRRKSYIFLGASMCIVATLGIGLGGYKSLYATTLLLLLYFWGSAICNVIGEALVVEAGRRDVNEEATARTVSVFFAFRKLSFATVSYLSGLLLAVMAKQYVFVVAAALPAAVLFATFALEEPQIQTVLPPKQQFKELWKVLKQPVLLNSTLFIFVMMATPSAGSIMFYFMTNELHFGPELLGRMALFQSLASLGGILVYMYCCSSTSIRRLLCVSTLAVTPFCLLPIVVIERWNVSLGIPDSVFVVTDTVLMEFAGEFQAMPILVLAARLCPPGLESTIYSVLLSAYNLGLGLGSLVSAGLTAALGISSTNFKGLSALTAICAISNLLPLCLLWLIPSTVRGPLSPSQLRIAGIKRRHKNPAEETDSTAADSDAAAATETSASNSDMEAGSRPWRAGASSSSNSSSNNNGSSSSSDGSVTRRGTVQVVDGDGTEVYAPFISRDSFAALHAEEVLLQRRPSKQQSIFECGGSGECAVPSQQQQQQQQQRW